jgi:hypothetical protein
MRKRSKKKLMTKQRKEMETNNSYLCNQLGNALFCVTSGIFAGRAQRDPAKSHELHKIAFPNVFPNVLKYQVGK